MNVKSVSLAPNRPWLAGEAPAERMRQLTDAAADLEQSALGWLSKPLGDHVELKQVAVDSVQENLRWVKEALAESMPTYLSARWIHDQYNDPNKYRIGGVDRIRVFANNPGQPETSSNLLYGWNPKTGLYDQDCVGSQVREIMQGFERIERAVTSSLMQDGPASGQTREIALPGGATKVVSAEETIRSMFGEQENKLSHLATLAALVREYGLRAGLHDPTAGEVPGGGKWYGVTLEGESQRQERARARQARAAQKQAPARPAGPHTPLNREERKELRAYMNWYRNEDPKASLGPVVGALVPKSLFRLRNKINDIGSWDPSKKDGRTPRQMLEDFRRIGEATREERERIEELWREHPEDYLW